MKKVSETLARYRQHQKLAGFAEPLYSLELRIKARELYTRGLSSRQVASQLGVGKSIVFLWCKDIARGQSVSAQLRQPPSSKHWRSSRQAARKKMERKLGRKLLSSEHVHHIDEDYTNNADSNLQVLDAQEHVRLHNLTRTRLAGGQFAPQGQ